MPLVSLVASQSEYYLTCCLVDALERLQTPRFANYRT